MTSSTSIAETTLIIKVRHCLYLAFPLPPWQRRRLWRVCPPPPWLSLLADRVDNQGAQAVRPGLVPKVLAGQGLPPKTPHQHTCCLGVLCEPVYADLVCRGAAQPIGNFTLYHQLAMAQLDFEISADIIMKPINKVTAESALPSRERQCLWLAFPRLRGDYRQCPLPCVSTASTVTTDSAFALRTHCLHGEHRQCLCLAFPQPGATVGIHTGTLR